jgi:AraC-like DNA-binding protein
MSHVSVIRAGQSKPIVGRGDQWHYHREMELTLIESGSGTRFVADHIEPFCVGDLVLIGANVPHYWHQNGHSAGLSLQWNFPADHGIWSFNETAVPLRTLSSTALRGLCFRGKTASAVADVLADMAPLAGLSRLAAFMRLLSILADTPAGDLRPLAAEPFSLDGTEEHQEAMSRAVSYILAHYREPIRLCELLRLTSMSRATFARQFRRHAGKSYSSFVNHVRLSAVCRALAETFEPISAIALTHGFSQLSFFNRLFHRQHGLTPSGYRSQWRRC